MCGLCIVVMMLVCLGVCCGVCVVSVCCGCFVWGWMCERCDGVKDGDVECGDDDLGVLCDVGVVLWWWKYVGVFVVLVFVMWVLRDGRGVLLWFGKVFGWVCRDAFAARSCAYETAVRVGLGNLLFFVFMFVVMFMVKESDWMSVCVRFNEGFWLVKGVIWFGLFVVAFAVTLNDYFGLVNVDWFFVVVFLLI